MTSGDFTSGNFAGPLHRLPIFRTSDAEQFADKTHAVFGATGAKLENARGFKAWGQFIQLGDLALGCGGCSTPLSLAFPESDFARMQIAWKGRGTTTTGGVTELVYQQHACVTSPGHAPHMSYEGGHERLTLRINSKSLMKTLTILLGAKPKGTLRFNSHTDLGHPHTRSMLELILFFGKLLDPQTTSFAPLVLHELKQALIVSFLHANRHTFSPLLEDDTPKASPREVRRAEEYIEANWNKPIRMEDLVTATNVSARSLFKSFHNARGYPPMAFAKMIRLKHAKEMLVTGDPSTSVTGVAFKCGFGNLGHFAKDYRVAFGELPSETLARTRRMSS